MAFDPKQFGATPVSTPTSTFDPSKFGATPVKSIGDVTQKKSNVIGPPSEPPEVKTSFLSKLGNAATGTANFLGIQKAAQGISTIGSPIAQTQATQSADTTQNASKLLTVLHTSTDPVQRQHLIDVLKSMGTDVSGVDVNPGLGLSNKEVLGSFGNVALTALSPGMPTGGASLASKVGAGAAFGYASDVASKANNNDKNFLTPGVGTAVGGTLPIIGKVGGSILKSLTGATTGAGKTVIQRAIDNPDAVNQAINKYANTPEAKQQLVDNVEEAVNNLVKQRNTAYGESIAKMAISGPDQLKAQELGTQISKLNAKFAQTGSAADKKALTEATDTYQKLISSTNINKDSVVNTFSNHLSTFGGSVGSDGNLVFKNSPLTAADKNNLTTAWHELKDWSDTSPQGFDALRQNISNHMNDFKIAGNSRANVVLGAVKKDLTKEMSAKIPGYGQALADYGDKSEALKSLQADLLTRSNSPTTQLNKVMSIFKKDPSVVKTLTTQMGEKDAHTLLNDISGAILSTWLPQGKALTRLGTEEAGIGAASALLHGGVAGIPGALPTVAGLAAASSPRLVGKTAVLAGKAAKTGVGAAFRKAATLAGSKANQ